MPVTWSIRVRALAATIFGVLAIHQDWRPTKITPGSGYAWYIALPLAAVSIALWLSLANAIGRRWSFGISAFVLAFTVLHVALDAIPDSSAAAWSVTLGPVGLAVIGALAYSARWWPRAFRALTRRSRPSEPGGPG